MNNTSGLNHLDVDNLPILGQSMSNYKIPLVKVKIDDHPSWKGQFLVWFERIIHISHCVQQTTSFGWSPHRSGPVHNYKSLYKWYHPNVWCIPLDFSLYRYQFYGWCWQLPKQNWGPNWLLDPDITRHHETLLRTQNKPLRKWKVAMGNPSKSRLECEHRLEMDIVHCHVWWSV